MDQQSQKELAIFSMFAPVSELAILPKTIDKRQPPEPDIFCQTRSEESIAFEMGEVIDQDLAQSIYGQLKLKNILEETFENQSSGAQEDIKRRLGNANIQVVYQDGLSYRKKAAAISQLMEELHNIEPDFEGEYIPNLVLDPNQTVKKIRVGRGRFVGPCFDVEAGAWFDDPIIDLLNQKFGKKYESPHPIELLLYYELQPKIVDPVSRDSFRGHIKATIDNSPFRRVWVFYTSLRSIRFVYPAI